MNVLFEGNTATGKDEWLTPPSIIKACGEFDLDPCSPIVRPWATAKHHFTIEDDGLQKEWFGRVWCNPPYGELAGRFLNKCARHGNAVGLVFTRCETEWFYKSIWDKADALLFIKGRLRFHHVTGEPGGSPGCGSVLIAYGQNNVEALQACSIPGKFIRL
jgi:hypothetical protein